MFAGDFNSKLEANLSDNVMFVGDFNSKLEAFDCAKKSNSGPVLKNIQSHLNLTYLNNDENTHLDKRTGNTDILDMAFISPEYFYPPENLDEYISDMVDDHDLVVDIDSDTLMRIVTFLKRGLPQAQTTHTMSFLG